LDRFRLYTLLLVVAVPLLLLVGMTRQWALLGIQSVYLILAPVTLVSVVLALGAMKARTRAGLNARNEGGEQPAHPVSS
jgi:hypothetical protein